MTDVKAPTITGQLVAAGWRKQPAQAECGQAIVTPGPLLGLACGKGATWSKTGQHNRCAQHALLAEQTETIERDRKAADLLDALHTEANAMNVRFDRLARIIAAGKAKQPHELLPAGTRVLVSTVSRGGHPLNLEAGTVTAIVNGTMYAHLDNQPGNGDSMIGRFIYIEPMADGLGAEPLDWQRVNAGHYVAGDPGAAGYTVRRDPNASPDNRWSLRHDGRKVSAHRLLDSAQRAAQAIADAEVRTAAPQPPTSAETRRRPSTTPLDVAASHGEPYVRGTAPAAEFTEVTFPTPICPVTDPHVKHRIDGTWREQCNGVGMDEIEVEAYAEHDEREAFTQNRRWVARHDLPSGRRVHIDAAIAQDHVDAMAEDARRSPVVVSPELADAAGLSGWVADRLVRELTPQSEQQHAQADEPAEPECGAELRTFPFGYCTRPAGHPMDSLGHDRPGARPAPVALPAPAARPTPVEAVAAHYRETQEWPAASDVVRRGADLDELHQALGDKLVERVEYRGRAVYQLPAPGAGEPLRVDDAVTVDPLRCGRQFDVINANDAGVDPELVQVFPRRPLSIEDTGRWVAREYTHRVPAEVVVPYEEDDDEPAAVEAPVGTVHGPIDRTAITSRRIGSLLDSGVDPDEVLRQILPVATDQPEQVRAWMTRHDIDPQALVPGEVADAIAADQAEALDANDAPAYRDPAVSGRWAGADDADRVELLRAAEAAAHEIDEHLSPAATPPADAAVYQVGALVVRKNDTAGYRVLRVTECITRGGVTPAPYLKMIDPFDGAADQCYASDVRPASLAEGLRISAPEQYREVLVQLLAPHGFTAPEGVDRLVLDMPDDGAFVIHDPTGVALCTMRDALRVAYPAVHAGEGDGDVGTAWLDLAYGTRYETVADVAVGLVHRIGQAAHASHMREVADALRELAGHPLNKSLVMAPPAELRALADRLVPPLSECKAAGYARRTTAVMHGVLVALYRLAEGDELVDPNALRGLAMRTVDLMTTPELLTAEGVAEHLAGRAGAALVADESVLPADVDGLIDTMQAAGYTLAPEVEYVGGKRVRYLTPPAAEAVAPPTSEQPAEATPPIDRRPPAYDFRLGDTWIDESNRQFRTIWRVAPDSVNGAPALFEANGPGYIPAVHLGSMRGAMRLVSRALHDERELPFEADGQVQPGYVAGWCMHRVAVSEWRAGLRVCERCPAPGEDHGDDIDDADVDAVLDAPTSERPLTRAQRDSAECGKTFTAGSMGNSYPCARPPHPDDDGIGCSVQRHPRPAASHPDDRSPYVGDGADGARRSADIDRAEADTYDTGSEAWQRCRSSAEAWDAQADRIDARGGDELPDGVTLVAAEDLVDAGGFLSCGCHGSAREHSCGPAAGDAFDPAAEV